MISKAEKGRLYDALGLFQPEFRTYIISLLKDKAGNNWIREFEKVLTPDKQRNWEKDINCGLLPEELIDFSHFKLFANRYKFLLKKDFPRKYQSLETWLGEICDVRNKIAHFNDVGRDEADMVWIHLRNIAKFLGKTDLVEQILKLQKSNTEEKSGKPDLAFDEEGTIVEELKTVVKEQDPFIQQDNLTDAENKPIQKSKRYKELPESTKIFAIDLGTTCTRIAVFNNGKSTILRNSKDQSSTLSLLAFSSEEGWVAGSKAASQLLIDPKNSFSALLRLLGTNYKDVVLHNFFLKNGVFTDKNGDVKIACPANGKCFTPVQLLAQMLYEIIESVGLKLGEQINKVIITYPNTASIKYLHKIKEVCELVGLDVLRIIPHGSVAGLAYGLNKKNDQTVIIIDFGGGSLDVSVVEIGEGAVEVKSKSGDIHLGGNDLDEALGKWIIDEFRRDQNVNLIFNETALARLKESVEKAKIELSLATQTEINLPFITNGPSGPKHLLIKLTRSKFEQLVEPVLQRLIPPIEEAIKDAGIEKGEIDEIVLVGGSTRVPKVQETVKEFFLKKPNRSVNPDEVVVLGAAVQASVLGGDKTDILLLNATSLSLGIETPEGVMTQMIARNTSIPTRKTEIFTTSTDFQSHFAIHVLEGESPQTDFNESLTVLFLEIAKPAKRGVPQLEVTFDIDANSSVNISAKELENGEEKKICLNSKSFTWSKANFNFSTPKKWLPVLVELAEETKEIEK